MQALRSLVYGFYFIAITLLMGVLYLPTLAIGREASVMAARHWAFMVIGGLRVICGVRYEVRGRENIPTGGALVAANHQSQWETIALLLVLPNPVFVLKREYFKLPIVGWWTQRAGMIGIDRKAGASALRDMRNKTRSAIAAGRQVVIFPEGTRVRLGEREDYKPGVAAMYKDADAVCTPIAHNSGYYWTHPGFMRRPGVVLVDVMPPLPPGLHRKSFMVELRKTIDASAEALATEAQS